jgi:CRISPR system Cascade subunit CasA
VSRYNLIDESWIPVRLLDGTRRDLGIRETLLRAKEIDAVEDGSPLVVAALHRFLLAVLYRALEGPTDIDQAKALFKTGLPAGKLEAYLKKWRDRFWLFDEKYPFGQNPNVPNDEIEPWMKLTAEHNSTTNKVLFDHSNTKIPEKKSAQECVRWLVSTMNFSVSGGRGYYPSPSPNAILCLPVGSDLEKTLCFNLVPYSNRDVAKHDTALWEREPKALPLNQPKRTAMGYADIYTWQSRMMHLEVDEAGRVGTVRFIAGEGYEIDGAFLDPMQSYREVKDKGPLPVQFRDGRGTWRDFESLLPDQSGLAPQTMQNAARLAKGHAADAPRSILTLGLKYAPPNANLDFWRMERFAFPGALTGNRYVRADIRKMLDLAEDTQKSLWSSCATYARSLLARGERQPAKLDVRNFVTQLPCLPLYWSRLEQQFHGLLQAYIHEEDYEKIELSWIKSVQDALRDSWGQFKTGALSDNAWAVRALVKAEGPVNRKLRENAGKIAEYKLFLDKEAA